MSRPLKIMLIAAEASGDALGAGLAQALKQRLGAEVAFVGVGGPKMAAEGVASPFDIAELSILGWIEGLKAYGIVKRRVADTVAHAVAEKPDAVVLIDSWGFTIRVAKALKEALPGVPLIKYVGPQVWASRPGRAKTLAQSVDHLLALYAFDAPWFEREGLETTVVGSQALHVDMSAADPAAFRARRGIAPDADLQAIDGIGVLMVAAAGRRLEKAPGFDARPVAERPRRGGWRRNGTGRRRRRLPFGAAQGTLRPRLGREAAQRRQQDQDARRRAPYGAGAAGCALAATSVRPSGRVTLSIRATGAPFFAGSTMTVTSSPALTIDRDRPRAVIETGFCVSATQFRTVPVSSIASNFRKQCGFAQIHSVTFPFSVTCFPVSNVAAP